MPYNRLKIAFIFCVLVTLSNCDDVDLPRLRIHSANQEITMIVYQEEGKIYYDVRRGGRLVVKSSRMGIERSDASFSDDLTIDSVSEIVPVSDEYQLLHGKQQNVKYAANEAFVYLSNSKDRSLGIQCRVSDDGVAFRYVFAEKTDSIVNVTEELTTFEFDSAAIAWLQPMSVAKTGWNSTNPSYEESYLYEVSPGTTSPLKEGFVFPALFKSDSTYIHITETGVNSSHVGSRLMPFKSGYTIGMPQAKEVFSGGGLLPRSTLPWNTPWRVITIGNLSTIFESTLGTDLADPAIDMEISNIVPGFASWSWALLKDESVNYDTTRLFIDYAASMNWEYCLIDVDWDTRIGYDRIKELVDYAKSKEVGIILWYNSSGDWNTTTYHPKSKLLNHQDRLREFAKLKEMGIAGLKIDFFGGDGQSMVAYYHDILKDAARYELLINFHGATLPRGWHRTYPNLMTMESVKGFEFITFTQETADEAPKHCTVLPFTRNTFDPMDFTPTTFGEIPNIDRSTSNVFELALPIIFLSGIQHIAATPWQMEEVEPEVKKILKNIPVRWEESRLLAGYPGRYLAVARRFGEHWYVAIINGQRESISLHLNLSFMSSSEFLSILDGDDGREFLISEKKLPEDGKLTVDIGPAGGAVFRSMSVVR